MNSNPDPNSKSNPGPDPAQPQGGVDGDPGDYPNDVITFETVMQDQILQFQKERDEANDQLLRLRAEFVNYQKRSKALADSDQKYAARPLALDLLQVLDNLERAIEAAREPGGKAAGPASANSAESIVSGIVMVQKQLLDALKKHGVEQIQALNQPFDPNMHEALMRQESAAHPENTVVAELGKGYRLHDRVLRPAKVAVSGKAGGS